MLDVADVIYQTGKTYLVQQGKFLAILFVFIGAAVAFISDGYQMLILDLAELP